MTNALNDVMFDQFDSDARNTVCMIGNARRWVGGPAHFDMPVAEVADVEVFSHSNHRLIFCLHTIQQGNQCRPKLVIRLSVLAFPNRQLANSRLAAPDCFGNLGLRHLAVTLDVGYYVFPVHTISITKNRYTQTIDRFLFYVRYDHGY